MALLASRVREVHALPLSQPVSLPMDADSYFQFNEEMISELWDKYQVKLVLDDRVL